MERIELARIIHDEKVRDVEATLRRRWLLRRDDTKIETEPRSAPPTAAEGSRTLAGQPAAPSPARSTSAVAEGSRTGRRQRLHVAMDRPDRHLQLGRQLASGT